MTHLYRPTPGIFRLKVGQTLAVEVDDVIRMFENNHRPMTTPDSQLQDWLVFLRKEHNIQSWLEVKDYKYYFTKLL